MWPVAVFLLLSICICCKRLWSTVATSIASHFSSRLRSAVCSLSTRWLDELWKAQVISGDQFVVHLSLPWFVYGLFLFIFGIRHCHLGNSRIEFGFQHRTCRVTQKEERDGKGVCDTSVRVCVIRCDQFFIPSLYLTSHNRIYWDANVAVHSLNVEGTFGTEWSHGSWVLEHVSCRNGIVLKQWDKICQMFISLSKKHSSKTL